MSSILFISLMNSDPWGGSEVQWFATAKYALQKGDKVTCLVYNWKAKKDRMKTLANMGATIVYIPNYGRPKKNLFQRLYFEWVTRLQQKLFIKQFNFKKFDYAVVNQGSFMEVTNSPWKNIYQKLPPYVLTFHNYILDYRFKKNKGNILIQWMQNAHYIICAAIKIIEVLETQLHQKFNKILPLVSPLTIEKSTNYTPYPPLDSNGNYVIIMLAQLDVNRKAQDNLIKAFASPVWKKRNCVLEIYGDGEHYTLLTNLINELELNNQVFLKGNTSNVAAVLNKCHLVLQITHMDAMPISVLEAMSKSRAVVVSNVGSMPLWIKDNQTGWITENASVNNINKVLEIAWSNKDKWEQMGKNAFDFFNANFPKSVEEEFYNTIKNPKNDFL